MKLLVLGDVHGNLIALEKVLKEYQNEVDLIISHGDVVNYGPWSNECVELLDTHQAICLKGNHEDAFLKGFYPGENILVKTFFEQTIGDFKYLEWIKKYELTYDVGTFTIQHTINNKYYYPDTDLSDLKLENDFIIGHSHYAFKRETNNGKLLINTGSVGQNRVDLSCVDFVVLDLKNDTAMLKTLHYDPSPLITEMRKQRYPEMCLAYYLSKMK